MKLSKFVIIAVLSGGIAFTSCRNNDRGLDDDVEIMESETTDAEMRTTMDPDDDLTTRIGENENLTTFRDNMERNQVDQNWNRTNREGAMAAEGTTGTTDQGTATTTDQGTTTGTTDQGTTTGQNQTTTGQNQTTTGQNQTTAQGQEMGVASVTYTIFAPSNDAYENLTEAQRNEMLDEQNRERNVASINYLMVEERLTEEDLRNQIQANGTHTINTMQGETITAVLDGDEILLTDASGNEARIIETDAGASGGVVHVIDRVLVPMDPSKNAAANRTNTNNTGNTGNNTNTGNSQ